MIVVRWRRRSIVGRSIIHPVGCALWSLSKPNVDFTDATGMFMAPINADIGRFQSDHEINGSKHEALLVVAGDCYARVNQ